MQIKGIAEELGLTVSLHNIAANDPNVFNNQYNTLVGFCYPTHGFNAPPAVLNFLVRFPKGKGDVFFLNTRAGMKLYKIHTPGLGGIALWLPALILISKGYKPIGFRPLDMPSNWISLHPGLRPKVVTSIKNHCGRTLVEFTDRILKGKPVLNGFLWLPIDIVLIPISFLYYLFGRFAIAKTFFANFNCNNCGLCIKQCPVNAIIPKNDRPYWTFNCESCMKCMNSCPKRAIETAHGYVFVLWWIAFSLVPYYFLKLLVHINLISKDFYNDYASLLLNGSILLLSWILIFLGYRLLHFLLGYKLLNRIVTYTSLTHYKFWRRYKLSKEQPQ
jgi:ferredoxin